MTENQGLSDREKQRIRHMISMFFVDFVSLFILFSVGIVIIAGLASFILWNNEFLKIVWAIKWLLSRIIVIISAFMALLGVFRESR
jgi:hypothetical protein